jgi:DNA-binding NarL/FixJ family response regulator
MAETANLDRGIGLVLSDDMMFTSRITGTARALEVDVKAARSPDALLTLAGSERPGCVIVDLGHSGLDISNFIRQLRDTCSPMPRIVAYGSHVDAAALRAAREAGCDVVLPRSKFVEELPHALRAWMG